MTTTPSETYVETAYVVAIVVIALGSAWYLAGAKSLDLNVPFVYSGDGLLVQAYIKRLIDNPWVNFSAEMGAPFGSYLYEYPVPDSGSLLAMKIIGLLTRNVGLTFNLYFFLGLPLNALAGYFVLRRFGLLRLSAFTGALIFGWLPFHFMRLGHLFYTWYFVVPLFIWFAYRIYIGQLDFFDRARSWKSKALDVGLLLAMSCFGVYYALFGVLTFLAAGVVVFSRSWNFRTLIVPGLAAAIVVAGVAINLTPNVIYRAQNGANPQSTPRNAPDSETYGLKIVQLVLPRPGHRYYPFARFNQRYSASFPLVNENSTASLGMIGSVGFIFLLLVLFRSRHDISPSDSLLFFLSIMTIQILIYCTVGGFSALFSLVTPMIRGWNRASVFIGFTSIAAAALLFDRLLRHPRASPVAMGAVSAGLIVLAYLDQTVTAHPATAKARQAIFHSDVKFIRTMENHFPQGSAIYQFPYFTFPESVYAPLTGYVHSDHLKWSFGVMRGREGHNAFLATAQKDIRLQIEDMRKLGFAGVQIYTDFFSDKGAGTIGAFKHWLQKEPVYSSNRSQAFFDLRSADALITPPPAGLAR